MDIKNRIKAFLKEKQDQFQSGLASPTGVVSSIPREDVVEPRLSEFQRMQQDRNRWLEEDRQSPNQDLPQPKPLRYAEPYGEEKLSGSEDPRQRAIGRLTSNPLTPQGGQPQGKAAVAPDIYQPIIEKAAKDYGIPVPILTQLLQQESGFNPNAKSGAGALGIAQFMPATAKGFGIDPMDPNQAIPAAAKYLSNNYKKYGRWDYSLAAYNAGGAAVNKYGGIPPYKETQNYVKSIMGAVGDQLQ